ncbi:LOW QUALITY PROTEIN: uncharacterized protein LOC143259802 [Megalopta genalis]|uniref:LOW QUALITY PROTEIN: uncharacterized protein LOC143259802 n=1 Tax=Megalopta genalis TaxID=115081 RepID=UPI003FD354AE
MQGRVQGNATSTSSRNDEPVYLATWWQMAGIRDGSVRAERKIRIGRICDRRSMPRGLCKFAHEVRVVPERPPRRPRRRRLSERYTLSPWGASKRGTREQRVRRNISEIAIITGGTDQKSCNTVVGRRYGLRTGAYRYTQALCRTEVEYGLYWRHLLHG